MFNPDSIITNPGVFAHLKKNNKSYKEKSCQDNCHDRFVFCFDPGKHHGYYYTILPMLTFILPGYSSKNKEWLEESAMSLKVEGYIRPIFWDHWDDPDAKFDAKEKASLISRHSKGDKLNIVAKSIGSLVASYIIEKVPDQINKVVICGIPLHDISEEEKESIKKALGSIPVEKILCFQNAGDPHASYLEVKKFLPKGVKLISEPRADHGYPFYAEFNKFLTS